MKKKNREVKFLEFKLELWFSCYRRDEPFDVVIETETLKLNKDKRSFELIDLREKRLKPVIGCKITNV